jgi:hypothetical protein
MVMNRLKKVFSSPELESVARDKPPRSTISDALVAAFCDLVDVVQPDMVLEIGAHEAAFSCEMKCRMPQAEILAFEANPHVYAIFEEKLRATGGVTYVWQAISDQDADVATLPRPASPSRAAHWMVRWVRAPARPPPSGSMSRVQWTACSPAPPRPCGRPRQ